MPLRDDDAVVPEFTPCLASGESLAAEDYSGWFVVNSDRDRP